MCVSCLGTPANFKWPGELIYIDHTLELAVWSRWTLFCIGIGTSGARASVLPVTLRTEVAVGFSDTIATTPKTIGLTDA